MKLGLSSCDKPLNADTFRSYRDNGITVMEVSHGHTQDPDACDFESVKSLAKECGIELWSYHLPFYPFEDIDISTPSMAEESVKMICLVRI